MVNYFVVDFVSSFFCSLWRLVSHRHDKHCENHMISCIVATIVQYHSEKFKPYTQKCKKKKALAQIQPINKQCIHFHQHQHCFHYSDKSKWFEACCFRIVDASVVNLLSSLVFSVCSYCCRCAWCKMIFFNLKIVASTEKSDSHVLGSTVSIRHLH